MNFFPKNYIKVFTDKECDDIIRYVENLNSWDIVVSEFSNTSYKKCNLEGLSWMNEKFIKYADDILNIKITHTKFVRCMKYEVGDLFEKHVDRHHNLEFYNTFAYNVNTILNEDFEGGDFISNDKIYPKNRGYVYHYDSDTIHEVTKITKGTRYSLLFGIFTDNIKRVHII